MSNKNTHLCRAANCGLEQLAATRSHTEHLLSSFLFPDYNTGATTGANARLIALQQALQTCRLVLALPVWSLLPPGPSTAAFTVEHLKWKKTELELMKELEGEEE